MTTTTPSSLPALHDVQLAFIGGGNMAAAIMGGLVRAGVPAAHIQVVDPLPATLEWLQQRLGVRTHTGAEQLGPCDVVVWAIKPQVFKTACRQAAPYCASALQLSVAAGIPGDSIAQWTGTQRVVRAMPNTPALTGQGATGLFARPSVTEPEKALVEQLLTPTGLLLWVEREEMLEAVTAVSGSGPAYVFYFLEAMVQAGQEMGLSATDARALAIATFSGAAALAANSDEDLAELRNRVTSKGGTTHAAIESMEGNHVRQAIIQAMRACRHRARELASEFGD